MTEIESPVDLFEKEVTEAAKQLDVPIDSVDRFGTVGSDQVYFGFERKEIYIVADFYDNDDKIPALNDITVVWERYKDETEHLYSGTNIRDALKIVKRKLKTL